MNVKQLLETTGWQLAAGEATDKELTGVYCGDLLSWVMGNGQEGQAWITVQVHMNIIAVAELREFSCVIIADHSSLSEELIQKANEEHITLIESGLPVYETARRLMEEGL